MKMILYLDNIKKCSIKKETEKGMDFLYQGKEYYFKYLKRKDNFLNELLAEIIARAYPIDCCKYYIGYKNNRIGAVSEKFDTTTFKSMSILLKDYYKTQFVEFYNNFEDIDELFYQRFGPETEERLMKDLVNIFLFDVLIGNPDRHSNNYGIWIKDKKIEFAPLFDNENMLSNIAVFSGTYSIGIDQNDFLEHFYFLSKDTTHLLEKFLIIGTKDYYDRLIEKLPLIRKENIKLILSELEEEIKIEDDLKKKIYIKFQNNKDQIENICEKVYQKRLKRE